MAQQQKEEQPQALTIERFLLFVGCADPNCAADHSHWQGWDALVCASNDLDAIRGECLSIPDHLWWQVVDLASCSVIMRSSYSDIPKH